MKLSFNYIAIDGKPPIDGKQPESHLISPWAIYVMSVMICVGVIIAVGLLMFNIVTIRKPYVYDCIDQSLSCLCSLMANSAPHINTIIIIGCIVMMATCTLLGIDSGTPQVTDGERKDILADITEYGKTRYAVICTVR
jgi:gamma-aminobutyric acid type B receptor